MPPNTEAEFLLMTAAPVAHPPKRLDRTIRMEMILDEAVRFFAEYGFSAQITDLAIAWLRRRCIGGGLSDGL